MFTTENLMFASLLFGLIAVVLLAKWIYQPKRDSRGRFVK